MNKTKHNAKNILKVSSGTTSSRVLGLLRDTLMFAYLGAGTVSSAFIFGFTIPNLFRRLMGEGALTSAFVPIFSHAIKDGNNESAFAFLNKIISRSFVFLTAITLVGILFSTLYALLIASDERFILGGTFTAILLPYLIVICIAAIVSAALNVIGSFTIPSLTAVWLNLIMILFLILGGILFKKNFESVAYMLCIGVLLGGIFQLLIPAIYLKKYGWRFKFDLSHSQEVNELFSLFIPAAIGASIIQANLFVSNILALYVNDYAVSTIYISNRLVEFPLGIFTFAVITVYFPKLSKLSAHKDSNGFSNEYSNGLITILFISIPAMIGLMMMSKEILQCLFQWGNFNNADVNMCSPILIISAMGIPFYSLATFSSRGFHSTKDTKTPVKISALAFLINLIIAISFMHKFGAKALVAANVASGVFQAFALNKSFARKNQTEKIFNEVWKIIIASLLMALFIYLGQISIENIFDGKIYSLMNLLLLIPLSVLFYGIILRALNFKHMQNLKGIFKKL